MKICIFVLTATLGSYFSCNATVLTYQMARNAVIEAEELLATGGNVLLSPKEKFVNKILMRLKSDEMQRGFEDPRTYAPGMHFFRAKHLIEQSNVFKFIKKMPKGAVLHGHNTAMVSSEWVIKNLTYYSGLLKCINQKGVVILTFRHPTEQSTWPCINITEERSRANDKESYDNELEKLINLHTPNPEADYLLISSVWPKFQNIFATLAEAISYLPAFRAYHWRLLEEMYEDGVMYIELRTSFGIAYDNSGKIYSEVEIAKEMKGIIDEFKRSHPNFLGAKIIYSTSRNVDIYKMEEKLEIFREAHRHLPNFMIGFDIVGQEDLGKPLYEFLPALKNLPDGTNFFFHAGETNWYGSSTDENILDAILLNTTRIGHGYAILKHPVLWNAIKKRGIPIEISPISNQVLHLVLDLRNHPAVFYMSQDIPIVISNDDPGFWNAKGMSYDYYYAFMCFTSARSGLRILKKLVWDSIKYSFLHQLERKDAAIILQRMWDTFLDNIITENSVSKRK